MTIEAFQITLGGLVADVVRKEIKNLHLAVYPPLGKVRVAAPLRMSDEAIRLALISRMAWIKRQRSQFEAQARQTEREYVSGESHYFQGKHYRLHVVYQKGTPQVSIHNKSTIKLSVREGSGRDQREAVLLQWYRRYLKEQVPALIAKWEAVVGVKVAAWGIKRMKTKWGTCNPKAGRIWLNLELAKKSVHCMEYVIVHELVHLLEANHGERFIAHMTKAMPQWESFREELNGSMLGHEQWKY